MAGLFGAGAHVHRARQDGAQPVAQVAGRDAGLAGDVDLVEGAPLADDALGLGQGEDRDARAAEGCAAAELDDAHDRVALGGRGAARDEHLLADLQFGAFAPWLRRSRVHRDPWRSGLGPA